MNYCSIEDAWGKVNYMSNQYKEHMSNNITKEYISNTHNVENFDNNTSNSQQQIQLNQPISYNTTQPSLDRRTDIPFNDVHDLYNCDDFIKHIKTCRKCYNKTKNYFKPKIMESIHELIECNKDSIVLILIGFSILLFFNLLNNLTYKNN